MAGIDKLIINSAYREPEHHWKYDMNGQTFVQEPGRRPAGYFIAGQGTNPVSYTHLTLPTTPEV